MNYNEISLSRPLSPQQSELEQKLLAQVADDNIRAVSFKLEEVLTVTPFSMKEDIFLLMEDMRKNYDVKLPDGMAMTISIGIATAFENASRYQELVRMADSAMFRAKYNGRNKVALAKEEKMVPKTSHYTQDQLKRLNLLSKREGIGEAILLREAMDMLLKKYDV